MIAIIAAMTGDGVIGRNGDIPWHIPEDLKLFKSLTQGHPVIMGRRTFESLGKPLPARRNIVVSKTWISDSTREVYPNLKTALTEAAKSDESVFLIGGRSIYEEGLDFADTLYLSMVKNVYEGDTHFPTFDRNGWECTDTREYPDFTFTTWKKR